MDSKEVRAMTKYVLMEYGSGGAGDRWPVAEVGILEMTAAEAAEMNRRLVWTPCRVLKADEKMVAELEGEP